MRYGWGATAVCSPPCYNDHKNQDLANAMTLMEQIEKELTQLPSEKQNEVLDFILSPTEIDDARFDVSDADRTNKVFYGEM